ncbi:MAG TPA: hypothetical protein PLP14_02075 [Chitinophagaceae bacterium]|nr:hypothetical protein [Chitinophagaceae bacterium]
MKGFFLLFFLCSSIRLFAQSESIYLDTGWTFHKVGAPRWLTAKVPGTVHTDLMDNHILRDPFFGTDEQKALWVNDCDWEYKTHFPDPFPVREDLHPDYLQFEGLDTYADVYLNEEKILEADNMFRCWVVNVTGKFKQNNELRIVFHSAVHRADSLQQAARPLIRPCENSRNYIRKAQFHFGWDWAPQLHSIGIWKRISIRTHIVEAAQARYSGVRLKQEEDAVGRSFYFEKEGTPIYMQGANWVPADVFLPRVSREKYRSLLCAAKEAHFNMLRVWGGGVYEDDAFYDLCDSLGIYVWQDFMFAGAMYPADSHTLNSMKQEAIDNILRLRKHPCIVLWCGNNEISEAWNNWGWQKQYGIGKEDSVFLWNEYQQVFEELLPSLVKQYDPQRDYIPGSPAIGWGRKESMTHGDSHYWGTWWGREPIQVLKEKIPRFMSEFGMQAMPNMESLIKFTRNQDLDTNSDVLKQHQKHPTGYQTLNYYLRTEQIPFHDFSSWVNATQELQARTLKTAIEAQRNSGGRCMGTLLWQFNDCWPVCSWSIVDYYGAKKKAYYEVKKAFE